MNTFTVIFEWKCTACGRVEHERVPMAHDPVNGWSGLPTKCVTPEGWTFIGDEAYCELHRVSKRPWIRIATERGPYEGNRAA